MSELHLTDDALDRLARRPGEETDPESNAHLAACPACRRKLTFLSAFYAALGEELARTPFAKVEALASATAGTPRTFRLQYHRPSPDLASLGVVEPNILLAAETVGEPRSPFATVATYVSVRDHVLARVTRLRGPGDYELTVITPGEEPPGRMMVALAGTPVPRPPCLTAPDGSAQLRLEEGIAWDALTLVASPPIARFPIPEGFFEMTELAAGSISLVPARREQEFSLEVRGAPQVRFVAFIAPDGQYTVVSFQDAPVIVPRPWETLTREVLLFA